MDAPVAELLLVDPGPDRERWVPLRELADEPEPLRRYLHEGDLYGLVGDDSGWTGTSRRPRAHWAADANRTITW